MIIRMIAGAAIGVLLALPAAVASAQQTPEPASSATLPPHHGLEAILYSDSLLRGSFHSVRAPTPNLNLPWTVRSIRVRSGEWQICTGRNYTGSCRTIDRDHRAARRWKPSPEDAWWPTCCAPGT